MKKQKKQMQQKKDKKEKERKIMFRFFWRTSPVTKKLYFESASPMLPLPGLVFLHASTRSL